MIKRKAVYFVKSPIHEVKPILYDSGKETGYFITENSELYDPNWNNRTRYDDHHRPYGNVPKLDGSGNKYNYSLIRLSKRAFEDEFHSYDYYSNLQIDHINPSVPLDNNVSNLEWVDNAENMRRAGETGVMIKKYKKDLVHQICQMICDNKPRWYIREKLSVNGQLIDDIRSGRSHKSVSSKYLDKGFEYKKFDREEENNKAREVCKLIVAGYSDGDIARILGVSSAKPWCIRNHKIFKNISSEFNI